MSSELPSSHLVHNKIVALLTELLDEAPHPLEGEGHDPTMHSLRFTACASDFSVHTMPHNDRAVRINVNVRIGRVHSGYSRALRWLSHNRARNTVALANSAYFWGDRDLWIDCNRITLPQDHEGMRLLLEDTLFEAHKVQTGLARWFPQLLPGANLSNIENGGDDDEINRMIIENPLDYLHWLRSDPDAAMEMHGLANAPVFAWLRLWQESLDWLDRCQEQIPAYDQSSEWQKTYWMQRCKALRQTGRYAELLAAADSLQALMEPDDDGAIPVMIRSCALAGLDRHQELLRRVHSSYYDTVPAIWYWRMVAHTKLEQIEQAIRCFEQYEEMLGPDLFARQFLAGHLPPQAPDDQEHAAE